MSHAILWMIISSSAHLVVDCQEFAHKLSRNVCIWHEVVDMISCGQSTGLRDQSQDGPKHVTEDFHFFFLNFRHTRFSKILSCGRHGTELYTQAYRSNSHKLSTSTRPCTLYNTRTGAVRQMVDDVQYLHSCYRSPDPV